MDNWLNWIIGALVLGLLALVAVAVSQDMEQAKINAWEKSELEANCKVIGDTVDSDGNSADRIRTIYKCGDMLRIR